MTATQIIHEIDCLPPAERIKVARYARQLDEVPQSSPEELGILAEQFVEATDPNEVERLREALTNGFYGHR